MNNARRTEIEITRERTGKFGHGFDAMCVCGRTKGRHTAEKPWTIDEDLEDGLGSCAGFKKARRTK